MCCGLLYSVALWHGDQAALYRAITAFRAAANMYIYSPKEGLRDEINAFLNVVSQPAWFYLNSLDVI